MRKLNLHISLFIILSILVSCSTDVAKKEETTAPKPKEIPAKVELTNDLELDVNGIACWINSMPGSEEPKFQVSGDIELNDDKEFDLEKIELKSVVISQDGNEIYFIRPAQDFELEKELKKKRIRFSTLQGLRLVEGLNKNKSANIELIFTDNKNKFSYYLNNIKIEEAY